MITEEFKRGLSFEDIADIVDDAEDFILEDAVRKAQRLFGKLSIADERRLRKGLLEVKISRINDRKKEFCRRYAAVNRV